MLQFNRRVDLMIVDVFSYDNLRGGDNLGVEIHIVPKEEYSSCHSDLHDVLSRIVKFSRTEIELYIKEKQTKL